MKATVVRECTINRTPRVKQLEGLFDVKPEAISRQTWEVDLELPEQWNVGVIVGASGSGKSSIAQELFGDHVVKGWDWPADRCILDGFPAEMGIKEITGLLSSVGFSSPPSWLRPFRVLSNGQQFRVNVARTLAEQKDLAVIDEFTSVVDRDVAKIGSAAVASTIRRRNQKFVAVTCHYDVIDWLDPDWVYEPHTGKLARGRLCRRPPIELKIVRSDTSAWRLFKGHHYLSGDIHSGSKCFVGLVWDRPAVFTAVLSLPHPRKPSWREHRTVCLPDFQGVGLGNAMSEYVAGLFKCMGKPYISTTSHPSMIRHRAKSKLWNMLRKPSMIHSKHDGSVDGLSEFASVGRITAGFEYTGPANREDAMRFGLIDSVGAPVRPGHRRSSVGR